MSTVCGLHCGSEYIVFTRRIGVDPGVDTVSIHPLDTSDGYESAVASAVADMRKKGLFDRGDSVVLAFDTAQLQLFSTRLPAEVTDVHEMMSWELMSRINGSVDDYVFAAIPSNGDSCIGAALPLKMVNFFKKLFKKHKLKIHSIDLSPFALFNLFELNYSSTLPAAIIQVSTSGTTLLYVQNGTIYSVMHIHSAMVEQDLKGGVEAVVKQAERFLERQHAPSDCTWYLTGDHLSDLHIRSLFLEGRENVEILTPFNRVRNGAGMDDESLDKFAPLVSVAVGLAQKGVKSA